MIKIECRSCMGDGWVRVGTAPPRKVECVTCGGRKTKWIEDHELRPSDVVVK
jgi:hypothetical protein